jgi:hypothetical protein
MRNTWTSSARRSPIVRGRVPVIAGTGSNSTREAVELTKLAHAAGADAMLVVAPYYNKPSQEGLFRHFCRHRRGHRPPDRALFHPRPLRDRDQRRRRGAPARQVRPRAPHQGGRRQRRPRGPAEAGHGVRYHRAERRRLPHPALHGRRCGGRDQRRLEPAREGDRPDGEGRARERLHQGDEAAPQTLPDLQGALHRAQPRADQGRARAGRHHQVR